MNRTRRVTTSAAETPPTRTTTATTTSAPAAASGSAVRGATDTARIGTSTATNTVTVAAVDSEPTPQPRSGRQFPYNRGPTGSTAARPSERAPARLIGRPPRPPDLRRGPRV